MPKAEAANPDTLTVRVETTHTGKVLRVGTARIPLPDQDKSAVEHPAHIAPPSLTQMHKQPYLSFPAAQLGQDLADVGIAMSTEEFRYYLTGIYLEPMPEGERVLGVDHGPLVSMAATDSHRLHRAIRDWPDEDKGCSSADACDLPSVIVPRQAVHWLAHWSKRLGKSGAKPLVTLRWTTRFLVANIGRATFTTRLVDGTFPDYRRVIPAPQQTYTLHAEAHRITASAKLVKNLLTDGDKAARIAADTSAAAPLTMGGASHGSGAAQTPVAGFTSYEGPQGAFEVGFNAGYIIDTMKPFGKSAVSIRIPDASAPTLVVSDDRPEFTVVLMPMRI
jgi:DNA polymerase-3 subunit beta